MARYKHYDYRQTKMLPVSFDRQVLPGSSEGAINRTAVYMLRMYSGVG
jgi:hypothetical protein